jgi:conserved oligomeric Golgi complex subunit 6
VNDHSLNPPLAILDHALILREIMTVYQSSLLGEEDKAAKVAGFEKILDIMVDPAVEMIASTSEEKKRLRPRWDQAVYVLNCLCYLDVRSL